MSLLLTLNLFHKFFCCFHCWTWLIKYRLLYHWPGKVRFSSVCFSVFSLTKSLCKTFWYAIEAAVCRCFSEHSSMFQVGVLKNFAFFTGKHLWWSLFSIMLQASSPNLLKVFTLLKELGPSFLLYLQKQSLVDVSQNWCS